MTTACERTKQQLADYLEGTLPGHLQKLFEDHLAGCDQCQEMFAVVTGRLDLLSEHEMGSTLDSVMAATCGTACGRVRGQLCDFVDGAMAAADRSLMEVHLQTCQACALLANQLSQMRSDLPEMAHLDPGPYFPRQVVRLIEQASSQTTASSLVAWTARALKRPGFSLEAAYVGTLVLFAALNFFSAIGLDIKVRNPVAVVDQQILVPVGRKAADVRRTLSNQSEKAATLIGNQFFSVRSGVIQSIRLLETVGYRLTSDAMHLYGGALEVVSDFTTPNSKAPGNSSSGPSQEEGRLGVKSSP